MRCRIKNNIQKINQQTELEDKNNNNFHKKLIKIKLELIKNKI